MLRVAVVTVGDTGRKTGGHLYNARVFSGLRERGLEVEEVVVCGASPDDQRSAIPHLGSTFDPSGFDVVVVDALARIVVAPYLHLWPASRPVVTLVHELPSVAGSESSSAASERAYEEPLLRADRLVAVSEHGRGVLLSRGVAPERIHVVPPGFDGIPVADEPDVERDGPIRALCVAQWIPRKGILILVEAWTLRERPGAVLELVGETSSDPEYEQRVRTAIEAARPGSIVVSGSVDDAALGGAYASADLFVLPSRYEGYGIVYAEALASGLPVIACEVGPVPELVGPEAAVLVQPDDREALAAALDRLLEDTAHRRRMSAAAARRASSLPRWEDTIAGFHAVLEAAAARATESMRTPSVDFRELREQNRLSWNAVVGAHNSHRGDLPDLIRSGGSTLFPEESGLLGDVRGNTLVHLQCNSGGDSISLARLGAEVTGVDISDEAVSSARDLALKTGVQVTFERADVYDWLQKAGREGRRFDTVFSSYGVVCWLPDLVAWAGGIASILVPGGCFVLVDFHPAVDTFDADWNLVRDYPAGGEPMLLGDGVGDYVAASGGGLTPAGFVEGVSGFENSEKAHLFGWGLGEVVTALAGAGLGISILEEYAYTNGERSFARMRELRGKRMFPPEGVPALPLMYGIRSEKG